MQRQALQFIEQLESQQLLSPEIVEELHRQVAESKTKLSPELLAKLLVDNGHLTKFQATKLIAELKDSADDAADSSQDNDELGLAPSEEPVTEATSAEDQPAVAAVFVDDAPVTDVEVVDDAPVEVVEAVQAVEVVEAVTAVSSESADSLDSAPRPAPKPVRPATPTSNPWDSFRILGVGLLLALVLVAGYFLVDFFLRGNAEERLNRANNAYEQRSYETAAAMYKDFAEAFPTNDNASFSRVRSALATLRKDSEGAPDPSIGLRTAQEVLPGIIDEPALKDQQSDLAGALIALAGKFNDRADQKDDTAERKDLMSQMDELLTLINDPQFVGATQRNQQAPTLLRIEENRQRILREINRDEELAKVLSEIDEKLASKDTLAAYQVRKELISRYPLLEANEALMERVEQASLIEQSLVASGTLQPKLGKAPPTTLTGRNFVLGNRTGGPSSQLDGYVIFVKVKGSVYGLDGGTGNVLWRNYVGREFKNDPIRLGETTAADALLCQPEKGHVWRVDGKTGESKWFVDFDTPIHEPVVESEDLFITTFDGQVASLDLAGGQVKWSKKLPQPIQVSPGLAFDKPHLYIPAEHSNLYVLARSDGSCKEVHYLGHRAGSIVVPPTLLLGQLFVYENINSESSKIRVLSTSNEGLDLQNAQVPFVVDGNIVVRPQIDRRRLVVQSDLGQILVLDIEPTLETQKVSTLASVPKNLLEPRLSWSVVRNNKVWVADTRFTRFDLQVSLGKLNGAWSKNDGDLFAGPPQLFEEVIVHTRRLRGNQGVRVAAIDAESGEPIWETDLGVPVTMLQAAGGKYDAINSGGMYFSLDNQPLRSSADANPGQGKSAMRFLNPVSITPSSSVLINRSKPNQFAWYSSEGGDKLRILSASFGRAQPTCSPVSIGEYFAIGLDNGQFVMLDPTNGAIVGSPYQPPMEVGRKVRWNTPVFLADSQTLIVASDLQKLVRLSVGDSLRVLTEVDLESPLTGPLVAMAGGQVCGVNATRSGDTLEFFDATSLEKKASLPLAGGRRISGPYPTQNGCILQSETKLVAVSPEAKQLWAVDFPNSPLVSAPVASGNHLVVATQSGQTWVIDPATGEVVGNSDAGQAFSSAPMILPAGILVGGDEGAVLALPLPTSRSEDL